MVSEQRLRTLGTNCSQYGYTVYPDFGGRKLRPGYADRMVSMGGKTDSLSARRASGRSDRGEQRRRAIIAAGIRAIEEAGPGANTGDFADRAGLNRAHIYRHFASKEELDREIALTLYHEHKARIREGIRERATPQEAVRGPIVHHVTWADEHPNLFRFLSSRRYARTDDTVGNEPSGFASEIAAGGALYFPGFHKDKYADDGFIIAIHGLIDASIQWWLDHRQETRDELIERLVSQTWLLLQQRLAETGIAMDATSSAGVSTPAQQNAMP